MNKIRQFIFNLFKEELNGYLKENIKESSKEFFKDFSKEEIKELLIEIGQEKFEDKINLNQFVFAREPINDSDTFERLVPFFKYELSKINFDYDLLFEDGITKTISESFDSWGDVVKYCNKIIVGKDSIYEGNFDPLAFKSPVLKLWFKFEGQNKIENWRFGNGFSSKEYEIKSLKNICFEVKRKLEDFPELMI